MVSEPGRTTVRVAIGAAMKRLEAAGVDGVALDARLLLAHVLGVERLSLAIDGDRVLPSDAIAAFDALVERRINHEPVSHILGTREFWSLPFIVTPATLAPRPDSETLVAAVLSHVRAGQAPPDLSMLDLGVGTGCLILALLHELPDATGFAVDRSEATAMVAHRNARALGLEGRLGLWVGDWDSALDPEKRFAVILSNPPYISDVEYAALAPDVARFEPSGALRGGPDGLAAYRRIIPAAAARLMSGGTLFLEIGAGQKQAVEGLCRGAGLQDVHTIQDLAGRDRVVLAKKLNDTGK